MIAALIIGGYLIVGVFAFRDTLRRMLDDGGGIAGEDVGMAALTGALWPLWWPIAVAAIPKGGKRDWSRLERWARR